MRTPFLPPISSLSSPSSLFPPFELRPHAFPCQTALSSSDLPLDGVGLTGGTFSKAFLNLGASRTRKTVACVQCVEVFGFEASPCTGDRNRVLLSFASMSHCVPDWDVTDGVLDVAMHPTDISVPAKGKWEPGQPRRPNFSEMAFVPDHDFGELCWENGQLLVVMQGQNSKAHKQRGWPTSPSLQDPTAGEVEDVTPLIGQFVPEKDGTLEAVVNDAGRVGEFSAVMQDEEMVAWLQCPLDEPLDNYCPELLSDISTVQSVKDYDRQVSGDSLHSTVQPGKDREGQVSGDSVHRSLVDLSGKSLDQTCNGYPGIRECEVLSKMTSADLTKVLDSGTAAGLVPQVGGQAFCNMRNPGLATGSPKPLNGFVFGSNPTRSSTVSSTVSTVSTATTTSGSDMVIQELESMAASSRMLPPKMQPVVASSYGPSQLGRTGSKNFSHFSRPAAIMKAGLHSIGTASGPTGSERLKQFDRVVVEACMSTDSSIESTISGRSLPGTRREGDTFLAGSNAPQILASSSILHSLSSRKETDSAVCADDSAVCSAKAVDRPNGFNSCVSSDAALEPEKGSEVLEAPEPTMTSSSGGSGNSAGKGGKVGGSWAKRKARDVEDSECQSEDPEDESVDLKKPPLARSTSTKRSRAAEIHNQSERRRRDRINDKMKALQELIPNSNKTDKASLLEEAIEYLKTLQTQLQVMSYRSGMSISPMLIPPGMQHLQMAQMASLPHVGMGFGMGMGMGMGVGMGMMDMGATSTGRHVLPLPSLSGSVVPGSAVPLVSASTLPTSAISAPALPQSSPPGPAVSVSTHYPAVPAAVKSGVESRDLLQKSNVMDFRAFAPRQQMHLPSQPVNMNMYNTLMLQQNQHLQRSNCNMGNAPPQ